MEVTKKIFQTEPLPKRELATNEQAGNTVKQPANNNGSKPKNVMDNLF